MSQLLLHKSYANLRYFDWLFVGIAEKFIELLQLLIQNYIEYRVHVGSNGPSLAGFLILHNFVDSSNEKASQRRGILSIVIEKT